MRPRILIASGLLVLMAGCQQPRDAETMAESSNNALVGLWTVNSSGYKNGVFQDGKMILTSCTEYKADGTYVTSQQYVTPKVNLNFTELGSWAYNGSFLTMTPTSKTRKVNSGTVNNEEPKVTGEVFQIEVIELTPSTMKRRAGTEVYEFVKADKPRSYTAADIKPAAKSSA